MSEAAERKYIRDSIGALEKATGTKPVGWSSPGLHESTRTPALVAAEGIRYICDFGNDEQPYKMNVKQGELYSLGPNAYLDDEYIHLDGRRTINEVNLMWRDWFDGLYADGARTGRMMIFNLHPWVIGQPWRIRHLDEVLGHITSHAAVWKATGREIARLVQVSNLTRTRNDNRKRSRLRIRVRTLRGLYRAGRCRDGVSHRRGHDRRHSHGHHKWSDNLPGDRRGLHRTRKGLQRCVHQPRHRGGADVAAATGYVRAGARSLPHQTVATSTIFPDLDQYKGLPLDYGRMESPSRTPM